MIQVNDHVMLDLETLGTMPGCVVLSIGAVTFDPNGDPADWKGESFVFNIDENSCRQAGLRIEPATLDWWQRQDPQARARLLIDPEPLPVVVEGFRCWWQRHRCKYLWSNGANFDEPIWRAAMRQTGQREPWKYWDVRDCRTILDVGNVDHRDVRRDGPAHSAYDDARHQVRCVQLAYRNLRKDLARAPWNTEVH